MSRWLFVLWLWLRSGETATEPSAAPQPVARPTVDVADADAATEVMRIAFAEESRALDFSLSLIDTLKRSAGTLVAIAVALAGLAVSGQRSSATPPDWWYYGSLIAFASSAVICLFVVMPLWKQRSSMHHDTVIRQHKQQSGSLYMIYACLVGIRRRDGVDPNHTLYKRLQTVFLLAVLILITGVVLWAIPTLTAVPATSELRPPPST